MIQEKLGKYENMAGRRAITGLEQQETEGMSRDKRTGSGISGQPLWDLAVHRMSKEVPNDVIRTWLKQLVLIEFRENKALVRYCGRDDLEKFKREYLDQLIQCLSAVSGKQTEIEIVCGKTESIGKKRKSIWFHAGKVLLGLVLLFVVGVAMVVAFNSSYNQRFEENFYQVGSGKINQNMRIIQISDLHSSSFGENNQDLVERIRELQPDLIVLTGDMIEENGGNMDVTLNLCRQLAELAPIYYIYGNHETMKSFDRNEMSLEEIDSLLGCDENSRSSEGFWDMKDELKTALEETGAHVLWNQYETIEVGTNQVDIYGVLTGNPYAFWQYAEDTYTEFRYENTDHFKIFLCHEPYLYEAWDGESWADLSFSGHTHGGQIRLPYVGGLYEYKYGFFPEFGSNRHMIAGQFDVEGKPVIISSGMAREDFLRINNPPELVIVDVNRY